MDTPSTLIIPAKDSASRNPGTNSDDWIPVSNMRLGG